MPASDSAATEVQGYIAPSLPREEDVGGETLTLRRATPADADRLHAFFLALPTADLLFLRRDVTDGRQIAIWMGEIEAGETVTILAMAGGEVLGEATLHLTGVPWTRHVGIVRVFTAFVQRGRGLGRLLLEELCRLAPSLGIEKLVAEMTVEQAPARRVLAELGFTEQAILKNFVHDRNGRRHDLVMMIADVADPDLPPLDSLDGWPAAWRCSACGVVTRLPEPPNHCPDCGAGAGFQLRVDED